MAGFERILQLKVALDTGELVAGMDDTASSMDRLTSQIGGFAKAAGLSLAAEGAALLVDKTTEGLARTQDLEAEYLNLAAALDAIGSEQNAADVMAEVSENARELGFDEVEAVQALNVILNTAGDTEEALAGLDAAMDLTRSQEELTDLAAGAELVRDVFAGDITASVDDFGAAMDEEAAAIDNVTEGFARYNTAAEDFASTTQGQKAVLDETVVQGFSELGDVLNDLAATVLPILINDLLPALHDAWVAIEPAVTAVLDAFQAIWELIQALEPLWGPILDVLARLFEDAFGDMVAAIEAVTKVVDGITGAIDSLTKFLQGADGAIGRATQNIADAILGPLREVQAFVSGFNPLGGLSDIAGGVGDLFPTSQNASGAAVIVNVSGDARIVETAVLGALRRSGERGGNPRVGLQRGRMRGRGFLA